MTHLILCREFPPAPYPAGGIGTYAHHIARLLAEAGETVHMIAQRSERAPEPIVRSHDGRLIVHRLSLEEPIGEDTSGEPGQREILHLLANSTCPTQVFSWQAARYAERLIETEPIDVIEAQEWEAPLYYLQARRAAGLGPARRPPCIVHLHSPTQMIFEHNEWDTTLTDYQPLIRFEEFTIRQADALLCPSHYLARQVVERYKLVPHPRSPAPVPCVTVIPYAMGVETPILPRSPEVWARHSVAFVGRLELRKGVIEWVDAGIQVATQNPTVTFDFYGSDTSLGGGAGPSVQSALKKRIPPALRARFHFHGSRSRAELLAALAHTALAVVPSRWENFPFTCIEAMSTGLPVLASPNGGMAEMLVDNESGWIASGQSAAALAVALERALATPAAERAAMGARAAAAIRHICANDTIVAAHIAFRRRVAGLDTTPSPTLPSPNTVTATFAAKAAAVFVANPRIGLVAPWVRRGALLDAGPCTLLPQPPGAILRPQTLHPAAIALTYPGPPILELPATHTPRPRYSGMALIANQSAAFAFRWFLAAPFNEKLRWLARIAAKPGRLIAWLTWRLRRLF